MALRLALPSKFTDGKSAEEADLSYGVDFEEARSRSYDSEEQGLQMAKAELLRDVVPCLRRAIEENQIRVFYICAPGAEIGYDVLCYLKESISLDTIDIKVEVRSKSWPIEIINRE